MNIENEKKEDNQDDGRTWVGPKQESSSAKEIFEAKLEKVIKFIEGRAYQFQREVFVKCHDCNLFGTNIKTGDNICGNCGSNNTTLYFSKEDIEMLVAFLMFLEK